MRSVPSKLATVAFGKSQLAGATHGHRPVVGSHR